MIKYDNNEVVYIKDFIAYIFNIVDVTKYVDVSTITKAVLTLEDMLELGLHNKEVYMKQSIGILHKTDDNNKFNYFQNPYDIDVVDEKIVRISDRIAYTKDKSLLLDYGVSLDNTIYLCLAKDLLLYAENENINQPFLINMYYPLLVKKGVQDNVSYASNIDRLIIENNNLLNAAYFLNKKKVHFLNDYYDNRTRDLDVRMEGIRELQCVIMPELNNTVISLDLLFRLLVTDKSYPLIKYNPSKGEKKYLSYLFFKFL